MRIEKCLPAVAMAAGVLVVSSCGKLGNLGSENFKVVPTPLEAMGGEVAATVNGVFPEKYMKKKAVVTVTPVLKFEGEELEGRSATFQGEKVEDNGTTIKYKVGGTYSMKVVFPFREEMLKSDLYARFDARLGKKTVSVPEVKIGYGVLATCGLLNGCNTKGATALDAYQRVIGQKQEANIKFLIGQANLRASEKKSVSLKELVEILKEINSMNEERALKNIEVSAYASPDGSFKVNERLAEKRQNVSADYMKQQLKKIRMNADVDTRFTAEDWEGFQELVSKSNLQDKDVILRVLSMYKDPEEREQQIRNMSSVYTEIAGGIMPELRRARLIVNYEVIGLSDEQIAEAMRKGGEGLTAEQMLRAANVLAGDAATRREWYGAMLKRYPDDCRAYNNLAQMAMADGNFDEAVALLAKAKERSGSSAETNANLALMALRKGDVAKAETLLAQGSGADEFKGIMGALCIAKGNYPLAARNLEGSVSNTAALAQILNKDYASASRTLAEIKNADGMTHYLKAVVAARTNNQAAVASELKAAAAMDAALGRRAAKDLEFEQFASAVDGILK